MATIEASASHLKRDPWEMAREQLRQVAALVDLTENMLEVLLEC